MPTTTAAAPAPAAPIISALTSAGVAAFWDSDEGFVVAHPDAFAADEAYWHLHVTVDPVSLEATAWAPDGVPDYDKIATVYNTAPTGPAGIEAARCAQAVAQWLTEPRPTAGGMLLAALARYGITTVDEHPGSSDGVTTYDGCRGTSYGIPFAQDTSPMRIRDGFHLCVRERNDLTAHVPAAHGGWDIFVHDDDGERIGDPLNVTGGAGLVDCAEDSAAAAAAIANYLTAPVSRRCDCYSQERYGRRHDRECNRYRRP
ncbi:hypothetical protein ACFUJY_29760 [Streptomyces sp. NPDC057249]|uniref:hypothetical protein n=1 Tax=Streptomyces sp. NPDC057249 TaxID=3346067 RepID=UPI00363FDB2D